MRPQPRAWAPWREGGSSALSPQRLGKDTDGEAGPSPVNMLEPPRPTPYFSRVAPKLQHPHPQELVRPSGPPAAPLPDPLVSICFLAPSPGPCVCLPA